MLVIDGGFSRPYHPETGIAGYTLVYHSRGFQLVQHLSLIHILVVGSASAQNWQHLTSNDLQGAYRTYGTVNGSETVADNAAITKEDAGTYTLATQGTFDKLINFIDDTKWYQLEVGQDGKIFSGANGTFVLIQERDTETGKVYLRAMPKATAEKNGAKLNASLWKIEYTKNDGVSGGYFRYINKETNLAITFDHTLIKNAEVSELRAGVNDWSWYTVNKNSAKFGLERVYSYPVSYTHLISPHRNR